MIAQGTKEELKAMISVGEKISIEAFSVTEKQLSKIKVMDNVNHVEYHDNILTVNTESGKSILANLISFIESNNRGFQSWRHCKNRWP